MGERGHTRRAFSLDRDQESSVLHASHQQLLGELFKNWPVFLLFLGDEATAALTWRSCHSLGEIGLAVHGLLKCGRRFVVDWFLLCVCFNIIQWVGNFRSI